MGRNWRDISYLAQGTARQRSAHSDLLRLGVLERLADFDAVLASTVCIDIDIPSSDLDIICEVHDVNRFECELFAAFGSLRAFQVRTSQGDPRTVVASFFHGEWEYEVFGQPVPIERQNAYRHMEQTYRIVTRGGDLWRTAIPSLKERGLKTEPAVALALGLEGDPFQAVLSLESLSDAELDIRLARAPIVSIS